MTRKTGIYSILCCLLTVFIGCKQQKQVVYASVTPVENKADDELFADILKNGFQFETFSSKLNLSLSTGTKSLNSKANLRILRDQALQISIQPLFGVEMFRLQVDKDSLILVDRMNKRYVHESIAELKETYPVGFDFYTLQALLTNRIFVAGRPEPEEGDYRNFEYSQSSDLLYYLKGKDIVSDIDYSFSIDSKDKIAFSNISYSKKRYALQWAYTDFTRIQNGNQFFPTTMHVVAATPNRNLNVGISLADIVVDEPFRLVMSAPSNYNRVSLQEALDFIVKM